MTDRIRTVRLILAVLLVGLGLATLWLHRLQRERGDAQAAPAAPPALYPVPDFTLVNSAGEPFGLAALAGKAWVGYFFFTTCPTICPPMTLKVAALQAAYRDRPDLHFVAISVNPGFDSPAVLADYAAAHGADTNRWHFLTGSLEAIADLSVNGLKIGSKEDPINHASHFVLVDGAGVVRGYYDALDAVALARLRADLELLVPGVAGRGPVTVSVPAAGR